MRERELGPYKSQCGREGGGGMRERELGPYKSQCGGLILFSPFLLSRLNFHARRGRAWSQARTMSFLEIPCTPVIVFCFPRWSML